MNDDNVHISSLLVQLQPEQIAAVSERCGTFEHVEVHATDPRGKMVLVLETPSQQQIVEFIDWLQNQRGVLSVNLVYHHVESARELEREMETDQGEGHTQARGDTEEFGGMGKTDDSNRGVSYEADAT